MNSTFNRRNFLQTAAVAGISALSLQQLIACTDKKQASAGIKLQPGQTILFQGDSITDAGRNFESTEANNFDALGKGYAFLTAAKLLNTQADKQLKTYNKGISGSKVFQLIERWDNDCILLKPDVLSLLIGVNDFWHTLDFGYDATVKTYEADYRKLLDKTTEKLPNTKLIIMEPFAIKSDVVNERWFPAFDEYRVAAKKVADDYKAFFIPLQSIFDEAQKIAPANYWAADGVHPSIAGAELIAQAWMSLIE